MRIKIIAALFFCFYFSPAISQDKKLLHSFEKHIRREPDIRMQGLIYFYGECKEDYIISLFSDSTFLISYSYSGTGNYYPNYKKHELAEGSFFNKAGIIYLVRNSSVVESVEMLFKLPSTVPKNDMPKQLEQLLTVNAPLKIEYSDISLTFYNSAGAFMNFTKENLFEKYRSLLSSNN